MKMIKRESALFRVLHMCVLNGILCQVILPATQAYAHASFAGAEKRYAEMPLIISRPAKPVAAEVAPADETAVVATRSQAASAGGAGGQGFSLNSTDELVDKFTGDMNYSITLTDVDGYPIQLSYNSSVDMNTEASWVGLGWDLNVGAVNREMRGLPDEFNGEQKVVRTYNQAAEENDGKKTGGYLAVAPTIPFGDWGEFAPSVQLTALKGKYTNTYIGNGKTFDFGLQAQVSLSGTETGLFIAPTFGFGYQSDSKRGIGKNHSYGLSAGRDNGIGSGVTGSLGVTYGKSMHSRQGLVEKTTTMSITGGYYGAKAGAIASFGATSSIPYGTRTSIPSVRFNSYGSSHNSGWDIYAGTKFGIVLTKIGFIRKSFYSNNAIVLSNHQITQPALGYFHSGKRKKYDELASTFGTVYPIMDFNRSNDQEYSQSMTNLPFSMQTYDVFRVNAMGLGATFRGRRQDVGTYYDPSNASSDLVGGGEKTIGVVLKVPKITLEAGYADVDGTGTTLSGNFPMSDGTNAVEFSQENKGNAFDSKVYFKGVGETTPEDLSDLQAVGGATPTYFMMDKSVDDKDILITNHMIGNDGFSSDVISSSLNASEPLVRATSYRPFTAADYQQEEYYYKSLSAFGPTAFSTAESISRVNPVVNANGTRAANHISAIEVVDTDGEKFVFGIPTYEVTNAQVSFCATGLSDNNGLVTYSGTDNSYDNTRGVSHYFDKTELPAYPTSFLLSEMLSSNYIDRTNNGPSLDDVGQYYKFNYTRLYNDNVGSRYKWRFPMGNSTAVMNEGNRGTTLDDVANYTYGEKEIWYTHSVETKNLIAEFYLEDRDDAYGVTGENGGLDLTKPLKRLAKIKVFNRSERLASATGATAVPIQVIEFEYSYELCRNNPSNKNTGTTYATSGKLTLKKIRSYSGTSEEGGLYTYEFDYDNTQNKDFSYEPDAWGNFKATNATKPTDAFPYAEQNATTANALAQNWKLTRIQTPSHGSIEIAYESDTYSTVQNRRAMKHMDMVGMTNIADLVDIQGGSTWNAAGAGNKMYQEFHNAFSSTSGSSYSAMHNFLDDFGGLDQSWVPNNVVIFKLDQSIPGTYNPATAATMLKQQSFMDPNMSAGTISELYFRMHVVVKDNTKEIIPTFGRIAADRNGISAIGVMPPLTSGGSYGYGYVILDPSLIEEGKNDGYVFNSLQRSALEFIRRNLPDKVYGTCPGCPTDLILDKAVSRHKEDINLIMSKAGWVPSMVNDYTTVRLFVPSNKKMGGNGRVKTVVYRDLWNEISGEYAGVYTWSYQYSEAADNFGNAAWEPDAMIDECPLYRWDTYVNVAEKYPDETMFTPAPATGVLFPPPVIGYEAVRVSMTGTGNKGYVINQFHTSRTHPVIEDMTPIDKFVNTDVPSNLLTGKTTERFGYGQGYTIQTNDFHGKPDHVKVYTIDQYGAPIMQSRATYFYAGDNDKMHMIDRDSYINDQYIAQEFDLHGDSRYIENTYKHREFGLSLKLTWTLPSPIPFPLILPTFSMSTRTEAFYSNVFVKHINRSAVVTKIETETMGTKNQVENLLYDHYTGNVLVAGMNDEYDDKVYSVNYPSHWYYGEMRDLASSQGTVVSAQIQTNGTITDMDQVLTPGDYVRVLNVPSQPAAWIARNNTAAIGALFLMDASGSASSFIPTTGTYQVQVIRSNRDNRLDEVMQTILTKKNPVVPYQGSFFMAFPTAEIIDCKVLTYRDRNSLKCGIPNSKENVNNNNEVTVNAKVNPYLLGARGDLEADGDYMWQGERINAQHAYKTRFDGTYATFVPFYTISEVNGILRWLRINEPGHTNYNAADLYQKWRKSAETTTYNEFGDAIESRTQLGIYSSIVYAYDRTFNLIPVAHGINARQQELAYDGFEDYGIYAEASALIANNVPHFDFKPNLNGSTVTLDQAQRHSGLSSLKLTGSASTSVTRKVGTACPVGTIADPTSGFEVKDCHCIDPFEPTPGEYVIGAWVRNDNPGSAANGQITVSVAGSSPSSVPVVASGPVIDGWQRMEGTFTIPPTGATSVTIQLQHTAGASANFDDIRIHPVLATMTTTVYDPKTFEPTAVHDAYNYTTFYNYDENMNLVRVRVETTEGIKTISESEMGGFKRPKP